MPGKLCLGIHDVAVDSSHVLQESQRHVGVDGGLVLNHQDELAVYQHGDVVVVALVQHLLQVYPLQGGGLHLQICAVEGVVEGEEVLLPVPVLGEVVHEE